VRGQSALVQTIQIALVSSRRMFILMNSKPNKLDLVSAIVLILGMVISTTSIAKDSVENVITPDELREIVDDLVQILPDQEWPSLNSSTYLNMDFKYELPNTETLYLILSDHGASTPWYKLFIKGNNNKFNLLRFAYPIFDEDFSDIKVIEEIPHARYDPEKGQLKSWMFWKAGDNSETATWSFNQSEENRFSLIKYQADTVTDQLTKYDVEIKY